MKLDDKNKSLSDKLEDKVKEYEIDEWCHYSDMPSPIAYMEENIKKDENKNNNKGK